MHDKYFFVFNSINTYDLGLKIIKRPIIPTPQKKIKVSNVEGADGSYYENLGSYDDIIITVELNFICKDNIKMRYRKIKAWLNNINNNKLFFSDDLDYFYKVKSIKSPDFETRLKILGKFIIEFTCNPYMYSFEGQQEFIISDNNKILYNNESYSSKPIIYLEGEGIVNLNINNEILTINLGQYITINSELELAYKEIGDFQNNKLKGKYPKLISGENKISWMLGNGAVLNKISIIPNWRCL